MLTRKRKREIEYQDSAQRALRLVRSFQFVSPARRRWNIVRTIIKRIWILRYMVWDRNMERVGRGEGPDIISRFEIIWHPLTLNIRPIRGTPPIGRGIARLMPLP